MKLLDGIKSSLSLIGGHKAMYFSTMAAEQILSYGGNMLFALMNKGVVNSVTAMDFEGFKAAAVVGVAALGVYMVSVLVSYLNMKSIRLIMYDIRIRLFRHMELLPVEYFEKNHSADSIYRLNSNVENMKRAYTNYFPNVVFAMGGGLVYCIFILFLDIRLGLISLVICSLSFLLNIVFAEPLRKIGGKIQRSKSELLSRLSDTLAGFRIIKLYDVEGSVADRYDKTNNRVMRLCIKRVAQMGAVDSLGQLLNFLNNFVLIAIGAVMAAKGVCDFGSVFAILSLQGNLSNMLTRFGGNWGQMQECVAASEMINEVFAQERERAGAENTEDRDAGSDYIEFKDVCFSYDRGKALDGLSLTVGKGQVAALVGPSGGGKSTIIRLIPELYQTETGRIYVDGRSIKSYTLKELRDMIGYVPQDAYLFDATIGENISCAKAGASEEEIIRAAKAANAHEFIMNLPNGYDTMTGERGETLSGGQRQRIAIARAFLKNAPILLLDEATSALDNENEQIVQASIEALMENRTVIVVAHRLSTIENADLIYVIENGRVTQKGSHESLKSVPGTYASLVKLAKG